MTKTTTTEPNSGRAGSANTATVAQVLEREQDQLIHDWLALVESKKT